MFVGEGPGADEDAQGLPFVGRAGQLLNNMIAAMGLKREEVYIANVVKCRPPGNRTPEPEEANTCSPFLFRQIDVVRPQVLVALGATAATYLLGAAAAAGRTARARACVSRDEADRHLSSRVSAARSAAEEGSLGRSADCDAGTGAEGAEPGVTFPGASSAHGTRNVPVAYLRSGPACRVRSFMSEPGLHPGWLQRLGSLWRLVIGWICIAFGLLGIVLPVIPGIPLLIAGLVLLSSQYRWAHASVVWMKARFRKARS